MITVNGDWFALETANTGYYLGVRGGLVENLHYGRAGTRGKFRAPAGKNGYRIWRRRGVPG